MITSVFVRALRALAWLGAASTLLAACAGTAPTRPSGWGEPEVLVDGDSWHVIRRRQTLDDLLHLES